MEEVLRRLADVRLVCLEVDLVAREASSLPRWLGSLVHGVVGKALSDMDRELYVRLFEPAKAPQGAPAHLRAMACPALVLAPPAVAANTRSMKPGDVLELGLVLPWRMAADVPYLVSAVATAAESGLGRSRRAFELVEARDSDGCVYRQGKWMRAVRTATAPLPAGQGTRLRIATRTPLRLQSRGKLIAKPELPELVLAAARRLAAHHVLFGDGAVNVQLDALARSAGGATLVEEDWSPFRDSRFSSRQRRRVWAEGIEGEATFAGGTVRSFAPLLASAARLGIGKGPAFGFGRFEVAVS